LNSDLYCNGLPYTIYILKLSKLNTLRYGLNLDLYWLKNRLTSTNVNMLLLNSIFPMSKWVSTACNNIPFIRQSLINFRQFIPRFLFTLHIFFSFTAISNGPSTCFINCKVSSTSSKLSTKVIFCDSSYFIVSYKIPKLVSTIN